MFKNIFGQKSTTSATEVKKNTQTADNIISSAVKNSGNISSITLNKKEQQALLTKRKKIPLYIIVLKYISLLFLAGSLGAFIFMKADIDKTNSYLGILGLPENTGSRFIKIKKENFELNNSFKNLTREVTDYEHRLENDLYGKNSDVVESLKSEQKNWFTTSKININTDTGKSELFTEYGMLDAVDEMINYFRSPKFQTIYFSKKEKKFNGNNYEDCKNPKISNTRKYNKNDLNCWSPIKYDMLNEIKLKNISINKSGASMNLEVSDILNKVFTLGSEFVDMMNSFDFYKNAEVKSFRRQKNSSGEMSMIISLKLEVQKEEEEDLADKNFEFFEIWKKHYGFSALKKSIKATPKIIQKDFKTQSKPKTKARVKPKN